MRKRLFLFLVVAVLMSVIMLGVWTQAAEEKSHYTPEYVKLDIKSLVEKEELTDEEYRVILWQSGVTKSGLEQLQQSDRKELLLQLQERFFSRVDIQCQRSDLIVRSERIVNKETNREKAKEEGAHFMVPLRRGDILISFSGHIFGWRNGHAAIVTDEKKGLTLEALTLGSESAICSIEKWRDYPCFALLRLKAEDEAAADEAAEYAEEKLVGLPYSLLPTEKDGMPMGTHCAHLVWLAYKQCGYDLDSDGGEIVTPADLFGSDLLEVIQLYGINPESLVGRSD